MFHSPNHLHTSCVIQFICLIPIVSRHFSKHCTLSFSCLKIYFHFLDIEFHSQHLCYIDSKPLSEYQLCSNQCLHLEHLLPFRYQSCIPTVCDSVATSCSIICTIQHILHAHPCWCHSTFFSLWTHGTHRNFPLMPTSVLFNLYPARLYH